MKTKDTIQDELIDDVVDACMQDEGYLRSIIRSYFETFTEDELREMHAAVFGAAED